MKKHTLYLVRIEPLSTFAVTVKKFTNANQDHFPLPSGFHAHQDRDAFAAV
jgi:hypothetical protein